MLAGGATKIHKKGKTGFSACKDAANSNFCGLNMIGPGCCSILNSGLVRVDVALLEEVCHCRDGL